MTHCPFSLYPSYTYHLYLFITFRLLVHHAYSKPKIQTNIITNFLHIERYSLWYIPSVPYLTLIPSRSASIIQVKITGKRRRCSKKKQKRETKQTYRMRRRTANSQSKLMSTICRVYRFILLLADK